MKSHRYAVRREWNAVYTRDYRNTAYPIIEIPFWNVKFERSKKRGESDISLFYEKM